MKLVINRKKALPVFLILILMLPAVSGYIHAIISRVGINIPTSTINQVVWIGALLIYVASFKVRLADLLFYLACIVVATFTFVCIENSWFTIERLFTLIFMTVPCYFLGLLYSDFKDIEDLMYKCSVIVLISNAFYLVFYLSSGKMLLTDNMDWAYKVLPSICLIVNHLFDKKSKMSVCMSILGCFMLLALGTRGPILCLIIFVILKYIKKNGIKKSVCIACVVLIVVELVLSSSAFNTQMLRMGKKLENAGFSPRIVEMLVLRNISDGNGRDSIKETLVEKIKEKPFTGYGIFSDRKLTKGLIDYEYSTKYTEGTYAHNIILEFFCDYGVVLGMILLVIVCLLIFFSFKKIENENSGGFLTFVVCGFVHLFVSGSYLQSTMFFCLLGICTAILRKRVIRDENIMDL